MDGYKSFLLTEVGVSLLRVKSKSISLLTSPENVLLFCCKRLLEVQYWGIIQEHDCSQFSLSLCQACGELGEISFFHCFFDQQPLSKVVGILVKTNSLNIILPVSHMKKYLLYSL